MWNVFEVSAMIGEVVHRALDYFFCDRCPFECDVNWLWFFIGEKLCPLSYLWRVLPEEPWNSSHPRRFPRSWMGKVLLDQGKQEEGGLRE